jgi:acetyltransferase-like isoleucine patch superfamily enzyme
MAMDEITTAAGNVLRKRAVPPKEHAWWLLSPYDLVFSIAVPLPPAIIRIGRFSLGMLSKIKLFPSGELKPRKVTIGSFCEYADDAQILCGGEHRNDSLFNITLTGFSQPYRDLMSRDNLNLAAPISSAETVLGDNVILSERALVLSGSRIETGCVIGAGAIVAGECQALGIYAGVPARRLRSRFSGAEIEQLYRAARLPDVNAHHVPDLPILLRDLQTKAITINQYLTKITFLRRRPTIYLNATIAKGIVTPTGIAGFGLDGERAVDQKSAGRLRRYFGQISEHPSGYVEWYPDVFHTLGLV